MDADNSMELEIGDEAAEKIEPNSLAYHESKRVNDRDDDDQADEPVRKRRKKKRDAKEYTITVKKKSFGEKLKDAIFGEQIKKEDLPEHIFLNIIVPNAMRMFSDSISGALNMTFKGFGVKGRTRDDSPYRTYDYSRPYREERRRVNTAANPDFGNYVFSSEEGVYDKIDSLNELLDEYEYVTVADVKSELGATPLAVDRKWGWKSVDDFTAEPSDDGYILVVPRARSLGD